MAKRCVCVLSRMAPEEVSMLDLFHLYVRPSVRRLTKHTQSEATDGRTSRTRFLKSFLMYAYGKNHKHRW